jgi:hypothetical protein
VGAAVGEAQAAGVSNVGKGIVCHSSTLVLPGMHHCPMLRGDSRVISLYPLPRLLM